MCRGSSIGSTDSQHSRMGSEGAPTWRRGIVGTGDVNTRQRTMGSANGDGKAGNSRGLRECCETKGLGDCKSGDASDAASAYVQVQQQSGKVSGGG